MMLDFLINCIFYGLAMISLFCGTIAFISVIIIILAIIIWIKITIKDWINKLKGEKENADT